ncbi:hypothetical protein DFJ73DRAFT_932999 [Zopfochytrium polystomum]|nr:hypothetical protein DFJ73DRAFT_932999 [Zopfochytrium polystomum]
MVQKNGHSPLCAMCSGRYQLVIAVGVTPFTYLNKIWKGSALTTSPRDMSNLAPQRRAGLNCIEASSHATIGEQLPNLASFKEQKKGSKTAGSDDDAEWMAPGFTPTFAPAKLSAQSETLSGGKQRKLTIAGASAILLLDEPTTGMEVTTTASVWHLLCAVAGASSESGHRRCSCTILLTTHSMEEAEALGDCVMGRSGRRAAGGPTRGPPRAKTKTATARMTKLSRSSPLPLTAKRSPAHDTTPPASATSSSSVDPVCVVLRNADPQNSTDLTTMFRELHDALAAGALPSVASVGLEQATLDDVFVKLKEVEDTSIANGESKWISSSARQPNPPKKKKRSNTDGGAVVWQWRPKGHPQL